MKNKQLFLDKLRKIEGKVNILRVMSTRPGTTVQDVHQICDEIDDLTDDINSMVEREETVYGR